MNEQPDSKAHRPYRPPIGIPSTGESRAQATAAALALHALLILLAIGPAIFVTSRLIDYTQQGAGGPVSSRGGVVVDRSRFPAESSTSRNESIS